MNPEHQQEQAVTPPVDEDIQRILDENEAGVGELIEVYRRAEERYTAATPTVWSETTYATTTG